MIDFLCRDCSYAKPLPGRDDCPKCKSAKIIQHPELYQLSVAHVDCDAFYASIEKRDNPDLLHKPVIVGGGRRGVVATACYIARIHGVRSAMPIFKARALCPDAVIIPPRMEAYRKAGLEIREALYALTPLVEPLSIDEAFMDLSGTERLHGMPPAASLAMLARQIKDELKLSVSIGLAGNKSMAKIASDQDKPEGFYVIGKREAKAWLADKPVGILYGVGKALLKKLEQSGIRTCADLAKSDPKKLHALAGAIAPSLQERASGLDAREISPKQKAKSISAETTLDDDSDDKAHLLAWLEQMCENVSLQLKKKNIAGSCITLKLKDSNFRSLTRSVTISPTASLEQIFTQSRALLERELEAGKKWRLIGVGVSSLKEDNPEYALDLADPDSKRKNQLEEAMDKVRSRYGRGTLIKGRRLAIKKKSSSK